MSAAIRGAEIDRQPQGLDDMLAARVAEIERAPGGVVGAGQHVCLQSVDRLAIVEAKEAVVHFMPTIEEPQATDLTAGARR